MDTAHYDLVILGSGSGNSLVTEDFADQKVAIVDGAERFGGTCLNVGCIPTKMFVYAAEVADTVRHASRYGIDARLDAVRWRDIRDRVFGRIDPISEGGRDYRRDGEGTEAYLGYARFVADRELEVTITRSGGHHEVGSVHRLTADRIVIATGSRPVVPEAVVASAVPFHTSDTIMRIDELPDSMAILGGGVIAAEFAHVFSALGVDVTVINRRPGMLRALGDTVSTAFTEVARQRWTLREGVELTGAAATDDGLELTLDDGSTVRTGLLLVATGRRPNSDRLGLEDTGVEIREDGRVVVDEHGRTTVEGVWAIGDVSAPHQLKHVANHEARVVAHNLAHPDDLRSFDHRYVPAGVFSHPQVATVGMTPEDASAAGLDAAVKAQAYGDTAYGWAMEDTTGVLWVVAERGTGRLLGAHAMGPQATVLLQPVVQALSFAGPDGVDVRELARGQYWIHPALTEVLENALLGAADAT